MWKRFFNTRTDENARVEKPAGYQKGSWQDLQCGDRTKFIEESAKRADFSSKPYARVTHMVRVRPSLADKFRATVVDLAQLQGRDWVHNAKAEYAERLARTVTKVDRHSAECRALAKAAIKQLSSESFSPAARTDPLANEFNFAEQIADTEEALKAALKDFGPTEEGQTVTRSVRALIDLYKDGGPLAPTTQTSFEDPGRETIDRPLLPYAPGNATRKVWLNLWNRPAPSSKSEVSELRVLWQGYDDNHTYTIWEDWEDARLNTGPSGFFENPDDKATRSINLKVTALDSFEACIEHLGDHAADFDWVHELLSVSHVWTLPLSDVELDLGAIEAGHPAALETLRSYANRLFPQKDQTREDAPRDDLVITRIAHGEAILILDHRQHSREQAPRERSTRALVLYSPRVSRASLGKLTKRVAEIEALRLLALRDQPYIYEINDVLADIGNNLSRVESAFFAKSHLPDVSPKKRRDDLNVLISKLASASARISALNYFIRSGVAGSAARAQEMHTLLERKINGLDEVPINHFNSLVQIYERFETAIQLLVTISRRYAKVRDRVDEVINVSRAEREREEAKSTHKRERWALGLSILVIGITYAALLIESPMENLGGRIETITAWIWGVGIFTGLVIAPAYAISLFSRYRRTPK